MTKKKEQTTEANNASHDDISISMDAKSQKSKKQKRSRGKEGRSKKHNKNRNDHDHDHDTKSTMEIYLKCEGIRTLRKEIETIIMEAAKNKR